MSNARHTRKQHQLLFMSENLGTLTYVRCFEDKRHPDLKSATSQRSDMRIDFIDRFFGNLAAKSVVNIAVCNLHLNTLLLT